MWRIKQIEEGVLSTEVDCLILHILYTQPHSLIANYNILYTYNNPMEGDKSDLWLLSG